MVSTEEQIALSIERYPLIRKVFDLASDRGSPIYLVGGTVRDLLLGRDTHDLDFATPGNGLALARSVADRLGGAYVPLDRERKTGRVLLLLDKDSFHPGGPHTDRPRTLHLDIASLRGDDLPADLRGRDFTINAMAIGLSPRGKWRLNDLLGGCQDLADKVLRVASQSSFIEDPVRMLRAIRLQTQFGCIIEPYTRRLLSETAPLLSQVSPERLRDEWFKILQQQGADKAVLELHQLGLLRTIASPVAPQESVSQNNLQQVKRFCHALASVRATERLWRAFQNGESDSQNVIPHTLYALAPQIRRRYKTHICDERTYLALLKCAALLHNAGPEPVDPSESQAAEIAAQLGRKWRCSNREVELLHTAARCHTRARQLADAPPMDRRTIYRYYRDTGEYGVDAAMVSLADSLADGTNSPACGWTRQAERIAQLLAPYLMQQTELLDPPPLLSGRDLIQLLQLAPGPQIGEILERLREEQAAGTIHTREAALAWAQQWTTPDTRTGR